MCSGWKLVPMEEADLSQHFFSIHQMYHPPPFSTFWFLILCISIIYSLRVHPIYFIPPAPSKIALPRACHAKTITNRKFFAESFSIPRILQIHGTPFRKKFSQITDFHLFFLLSYSIISITYLNSPFLIRIRSNSGPRFTCMYCTRYALITYPYSFWFLFPIFPTFAKVPYPQTVICIFQGYQRIVFIYVDEARWC